MSTKPKTPIKVNAKTVAVTPAKVAAKPVKSSAAKLPIKVRKLGLQIAAPIHAEPIRPVANHSKQSQLIACLRSTSGVTIEEMMILTGWQAHSLRGAISGALRKRLGLNVVTSPAVNGQSRVYRIVDQVSV
jgi:hypothetical protein